MSPGYLGKLGRSERWFVLVAVATSLLFVAFPVCDRWQQAGAAPSGDIVVFARAGELGGFSPSTVEVIAPGALRLSFWAMDVTHSFALPPLGIDLVLPVGEAVPLTIDTDFGESDTEYWYVVHGRRFAFPKSQGAAAQPLVLEFKCNRYCTAQHWSMRGEFIVHPPAGPARSRP